jgi:hypothetical protein
LEVLQPSIPVCGSAQDYCSAMLHIQAAAGLLVVADRAGAMHAFQLIADAPDQPVHASTLKAAAPESLKYASSGVLRFSVKAVSEGFCLPLGAEASPSLAEMERAVVEQVIVEACVVLQLLYRSSSVYQKCVTCSPKERS